MSVGCFIHRIIEIAGIKNGEIRDMYNEAKRVIDQWVTRHSFAKLGSRMLEN